MKHAFLIIAYDNWWQLKRLIQLLDYKNHDIYIHIDKKSKDFDVNFFNNITDYSSVYFFQEYDVYWGGQLCKWNYYYFEKQIVIIMTIIICFLGWIYLS